MTLKQKLVEAERLGLQVEVASPRIYNITGPGYAVKLTEYDDEHWDNLLDEDKHAERVKDLELANQRAAKLADELRAQAFRDQHEEVS